MGATVFRAGFRTEARVNFLHKSFLAFEAHYESIILIYLAVKFFLAGRIHLMKHSPQGGSIIGPFRRGNYSVKKRPNPNQHLVF